MSAPLRATRALALTAALVLSASAAQAAAPGLLGFTGGSHFATFQANGDTIGWSFSTNRPLVVTHLGYWDGDAGTGSTNLQSHPVGLWNSAGVLLTSNSVGAASPFTGDWRYEPTSNIVIGTGQTFHLGAFVAGTNTNADGYRSTTTAQSLTAGVTGVNSLRDPDGVQTGLIFPSVTGAFNGRFGPNFLFEEIPEPASISLFAAAAMLVGRRQR